jgi:hypothetical protein
MLLGGVTAGLAGQNAQAGATAAENEVLNNSLGDHRSEEQKDEDELKKEMSEVDSKLPGYGKVIIGYDEEGDPEYVVKPPASLFAGGGTTGSSQAASGNTAQAGGGSAFEVNVGNGANDWSDASAANNGAMSPVGISGSPMTVPQGTNTWFDGGQRVVSVGSTCDPRCV